MTDTDRMVPLGTLPDLSWDSDGIPVRIGREARRDYDTVVLPAVQLDLAGIREARELLDKAEREILRYRFRTADMTGIGLASAESDLDFLGFHDRPLESVNWVEVGRTLDRIHSVSYLGGLDNVRKLHALLMSDETEAAETDAPLADRCAYHGGEGDGGLFCDECEPATEDAS